jgi:hypothetical protein
MTRARAGWGRRGPLLAALLAAGLGCAKDKHVRVDFSETPREYLAKDYEKVYERWTRHQYTLHEVDKALEVWATFKSWDFREAYIERYVATYGLAAEERDTLRKAQLEAFRRAYEFHVTAQSSEYKWNDLEKKSSPWRITLVDALGHELAPETIKVEKLPDAYESIFFPTKTPFSKTYTIRFVPEPEGEFVGLKSGALTLRIVSPIGKIELDWQSS